MTAPSSFGNAIAVGVQRGLVGCALIGSGLLATHWLTAGHDDITTPVERPPAAASPTSLLEQHDCWTGEAPADVEIPGHVIWQHTDGRTVYSSHLVGPALDTLFADGNLPGDLIAFCR